MRSRDRSKVLIVMVLIVQTADCLLYLALHYMRCHAKKAEAEYLSIKIHNN